VSGDALKAHEPLGLAIAEPWMLHTSAVVVFRASRDFFLPGFDPDSCWSGWKNKAELPRSCLRTVSTIQPEEPNKTVNSDNDSLVRVGGFRSKTALCDWRERRAVAAPQIKECMRLLAKPIARGLGRPTLITLPGQYMPPRVGGAIVSANAAALEIIWQPEGPERRPYQPTALDVVANGTAAMTDTSSAFGSEVLPHLAVA